MTLRWAHLFIFTSGVETALRSWSLALHSLRWENLEQPLLLCRITHSICTKEMFETYLQSSVFELKEERDADVRKRKARCKGNTILRNSKPVSNQWQHKDFHVILSQPDRNFQPIRMRLQGHMILAPLYNRIIGYPYYNTIAISTCTRTLSQCRSFSPRVRVRSIDASSTFEFP